ncbi:putative tyrosinase 2 protein [Eutypa lata UCREL1]|uniref:tyrosinase n=1 Tax=Eutypa lata (strain UCR-EL1) TaxID=1287681 RepID=M7SFL8_EUTLA|nr:putative tyrosinase 2 protein [Eutypa lata UCREL1]
MLAVKGLFTIVALQLIGEKVQQLAKEYTGEDASKYDAAAQLFRVPYWDWGTDARVPPSCTRQNITVNGPDGRITMHNPLYSYRWLEHPLDPNQFPGSEQWGDETTRSPNGDSDFPVDEVNAKLSQQAEIITLRVYRAFSSSNTYEEMASMTGNGASFEAPHNDIHNLVGGSFATLTVTSFDILFMLHHCNLDRLAAMWSIIHYGSTVQTIPYQSSGLFATPQGEEITADSPLKPFYQKDGKSFHTSRSVLGISDFGYTYPEFEDLDDSDPYQNSRHMIEIVNDLYGSILPPAVKRPHQKAWHVEGTTKDWVVFIEVERSELELPCTINVYMRDKYAGRTTLLNMPMHGLLSDEIPLTQAVNASEFKGMPADAIEDQLEEGLRFEIKKDDGTIIDPSTVPSLKLDVQGFDVTPPSSSSEFPSYNRGKHSYSKVFIKYNGTKSMVP